MSKTVVVDLDEDAPVTNETVVSEDAPLEVAAKGVDVVDEDVDPLDRLPPHVIQNTDGSVTLPLKFPVTLKISKLGNVREESYSKLTMYRLRGADFRAIGATSEGTKDIVALARSTRLSQAVMNALYDRMDGSDITAAGQVLNSFFATGRTTGK